MNLKYAARPSAAHTIAGHAADVATAATHAAVKSGMDPVAARTVYADTYAAAMVG